MRRSGRAESEALAGDYWDRMEEEVCPENITLPRQRTHNWDENILATKQHCHTCRVQELAALLRALTSVLERPKKGKGRR